MQPPAFGSHCQSSRIHQTYGPITLTTCLHPGHSACRQTRCSQVSQVICWCNFKALCDWRKNIYHDGLLMGKLWTFANTLFRLAPPEYHWFLRFFKMAVSYLNEIKKIPHQCQAFSLFILFLLPVHKIKQNNCAITLIATYFAQSWKMRPFFFYHDYSLFMTSIGF